jgi:hypothetical protein
MASVASAYHFTPEEFLRAWDAGAFSTHVEMVEGEVWPVSIGQWHGDTTGRITRALPNDRFVVTTASLITEDSVPDPDCWMRPAAAEGVDRVGRRLTRWEPTDVLLVVEVADETVAQDLGTKAGVYGRAGFSVYWVATREGIFEHSDPTPRGYRTRTTYRPGETIPVRHAATELAVDDLLAPSAD